MFTFYNNAIAHIPKCGGHALAKMMSKAGINFKSPFVVENGKILDSGPKHQSFADFAFKADVKKFCLIRRLDDWWKSFMWHQSKHVKVNANGNMTKILEKSYSKKQKEREGQLLLPKYTCHSRYPDHLINQILGGEDLAYIHFLRMEHLIADFHLQFQITLPPVPHTSSYSPPERYWNEETKKILYENNPLWAKLEETLYSKVSNSESEQVQL